MTSPAQSPLHIGLMVPVNNTTMEGESTAWLPGVIVDSIDCLASAAHARVDAAARVGKRVIAPA